MIYEQLFHRTQSAKVVKAGLVGSGQFGTAIVTQSQSIPLLDVAVIADVDIEKARRAYRLAGIADADVVICDGCAAALEAMESGKRVVVQDAMILMDLPLDVIAEATGAPDAGARHAFAAIQHGKHVVMVNKEADVAVGPYLAYLAERAGVVYTPVDGDHHGILVGLVGWARSLGLEIICAGKVRTTEFVYNAAAATITAGRRVVAVPADKAWAWDKVQPGMVASCLATRRETVTSIPLGSHADVAELAIASNALGFRPDHFELHRPVLRTTELPEVFSSVEDGGILHEYPAVEMISCLRGEQEAGLGGGLFVTVSCTNSYSREIITTKGCLANSSGGTALIYRPYHLCGVEAPTSLLCAGLVGLPTGSLTNRPVIDAVGRATRDLAQGTLISDRTPDFFAMLSRAAPLGVGNPVSYYMAVGHRLVRDIPAGTILTADMVAAPVDSFLWSLRRQQDEHFLASR